MAIIELAHVKLLGGISISDPSLRQNMQKVTDVIEGYNHLRNLFYVEVEDPSILYVIGAWESQEQHQRGFNGSLDQDKILELVKDQMDIDWMYYIDVEQSKIPLDAPVLEIKRYTLPSNADKQTFHKALAAEMLNLEAPPEGSVGAWNLPKSDGEEAVWVQFSGWKSVDDHRNAAGDNRAVESLVEMIDVKHATRVHLP
jgi:hypothetical protein